jgi:hypothetical protein
MLQNRLAAGVFYKNQFYKKASQSCPVHIHVLASNAIGGKGLVADVSGVHSIEVQFF